MKKVLIIEDDHIVGSIYRRKFQAEGFQVSLAVDGEAGVQAVDDFHPDIVILDLMLPRLNGVEVLRRIRAKPASANLPVIVLSNAYLSSLIQDAQKAGANQCLIKANCTPKQVLDIIHKALSSAPPTPVSPPTAPPVGSPPSPPPPPRPAPAGPAPISTPPPTHPAPSPAPPRDDQAFQTELRQTFLAGSGEVLAQLRAFLQTFVKADGDAERLPNLFALYRRVHSVTSNAAVAGMTNISRLSSALEALLKELYEKPKNINASTTRTIAQTIDFLGQLFEHSTLIQLDSFTPPNILVVDDEAISRRAIIYALEKANLRCASVDDPNTALEMLAGTRFNLIFLDVDMPGLNGFELCSRLRNLPTNAKTPVIFVTSLNDFESRARSTLSGGNDLIAKPFLFMELAVKAITHILRGILAERRQESAA